MCQSTRSAAGTRRCRRPRLRCGRRHPATPAGPQVTVRRVAGRTIMAESATESAQPALTSIQSVAGSPSLREG